jgi:NitT/TauT family transport system substrate-binding protein
MFSKRNEPNKLSTMISRFQFVSLLSSVLLLYVSNPAWPQTERIRISATGRSFTQLPIRIAEVKGYYRQEGLEIEYIQMAGQLATTSLFGGHVDATTAFSSSAIGAVRGFDAKGVIVFCDKPTFVLVSRPRIRSVAELKGMKIAVSSFGSSGDLITRKILTHYGLNPARDTVILALGQASVRLAALHTGAVDATVLSTPENILAERGGASRLAESAKIIEMPLAGLVVTQNKIETNRNQVKRIVKATLRGLMLVHQNRQEAIDIATAWMRLDPEFAAAGYDATLPAYSLDGFASDQGLRTMLEIVTKGKMSEFSSSRLADFSFLREALAELKAGK